MPHCRIRHAHTAQALLALACLLCWPGCREVDAPQGLIKDQLILRAATIAWKGRESLFASDHAWRWQVADPDSSGHAPAGGTAWVRWLPADKRYNRRRPLCWTLTPAPTLPARIRFIPRDSSLWHGFTCEVVDAKASPEPILRILTDSSDYANLLDFARHLTTGYFDQVVRHWQPGPIPVRCGQEVSGEVDLSACLRRAVAIWNSGTRDPWFVVDESATWGVRLLHYRDSRLRPPLQAQLTRQDVHGNPVRMNIRVGDNYRTSRDTTYVIRGMVHELAHTLLLWGHSTDREHCLWGAAPPLVKEPSQDERKAAQLLRDLPVGLDLKDYRVLSASE